MQLVQPKLYAIALGSLFERFSYYGMLTILVLYLTHKFSFTDNDSFIFYGAYTTLAFGLPVLGGFIADKFLNSRHAMIIGFLLLITGNLLMAIPAYHSFCIGIGCLIAGTSFYKPNSSGFFGLICKEQNYHQERGFTMFYVAMNIGGMLGPIFYGVIAQQLGWNYSFILSAILLSVAFMVFLYLFPNKEHFKPKYILNAILFLVAILIGQLFYYYQIMGKVFGMVLICLVVLVIIVIGKELRQNKSLAGLLILCAFVTLFFSGSLQVVSSISLFIERDVNRVFFDWTIPTAAFSALYPFAVVVVAPLLTFIWTKLKKVGREPIIPAKVSIGLFCCSLGFVLFTLATTVNHQTHLPILWIVAANFLLGTGEMCIMPSILSAMSQYSPENLRNTMMGVLYLFIAFSGYLSGILARLSDNHGILFHSFSNNEYGNAFIEIALLICVMGFVLFFMRSFLNKMFNSSVGIK